MTHIDNSIYIFDREDLIKVAKELSIEDISFYHLKVKRGIINRASYIIFYDNNNRAVKVLKDRLPIIY